MRMIREEVVAPGAVTSNVPITEAAWTAGTYTQGTQRAVGTDLYEVTAASTTDEPTAGAAKETPTWVRIGKVNRFRMCSEFIAEKTVAPSPIEIEIATSPRVNAVALFGLEAAEIEVITYSEGEETRRVLKGMTNVNEVADWYEYFFQRVIKIEEGVVLDLPSYGTDRMVIRVTNDDAPAAIGKLVLGEQVQLGNTRAEYGAGIEDYSRKERDDFGGFQIVERRFSRRADFGVLIPSGRLPFVLRELASVRAQPTVYIGDPDHPATIIIGFYKDAWATRHAAGIAEMTLEIEGLT